MPRQPTGSPANVSPRVDTLPAPRHPEDDMPILPDDPEAALAVLEELAERERQARTTADQALELRDAAIVELVDTRKDISKVLAGLRMRLSRARLYHIRTEHQARQAKAAR
jgi:hypothetical protein